MKNSGRARRRTLRTVLLGILALAAICFALFAWFDRSAYEISLLLAAGAITVAVLAALGALSGYLIYRLRAQRKMRNASGSELNE